MTSLYPLVAAPIAFVSLPSGALPKHVRDLGGHAWISNVATWMESAADAENVPLPLLAALILSESQLDPNAVSSARAAGLGQLNPKTPLGREWLAACRLLRDADECAEANVRIAARALSAALVRCKGDRRCAVARYRGAWPRVRPRDVHVVLTAQKIARRIRPVSLVACEGGSI